MSGVATDVEMGIEEIEKLIAKEIELEEEFEVSITFKFILYCLTNY